MEEKEFFREKVLQTAVGRGASQGLWAQPHTWRHRDLAPEDLGLNLDWATPPLRKGAYSQWIRVVVSANQIICIYKVLQLSENPTVTTLRLSNGPSIKGIHELEACYSGLPTLKSLRKALMSREGKEALNRLAGRDNPVSPELLGTPMEVYFSEPYLLEPLTLWTIEVKARKDSAGDYLVLGGFVVEPAGARIV
jgi:hypothetical protein